MKTLTKELWMDVPERRAIISIHSECDELVRESTIQDGLILINVMQKALHLRSLA